MFPIAWRMESLFQFLHKLLYFYLSITTTILQYSLFYPFSKTQFLPIITPFLDKLLSFYFIIFCNLSPCKVDLDAITTVHFWVPNHRKIHKPNLVLIHGYGGNAKWQFVFQVGPLARFFNLYIPDLLFFGESKSENPARTDVFQAKCLCEGMKRLGVERYSLHAISYGGYVGYRMAEMSSPEIIDKVIILSSGVGCGEDKKMEQVEKVGGIGNVLDLLLPQKADDLRRLVNLSFCKYDPLKWVPDFFLHDFINAVCKNNRKERKELAEYLIMNKADSDFRALNQESLLIWGDNDMVFPPTFGYDLQRVLGSKVKLEIIQKTGHAANLESPHLVADLIKEFVLGSSEFDPNCNINDDV